MTGKELLEKLGPLFLKVGPNERTANLYGEISASLSDFITLDTFFQLRKNQKGQGLALEILLFNGYFFHDIVFSQTTTDHITIQTKDVKRIFIETNYGVTPNDKGENIAVDLLHCTITFGDGMNSLVYRTDVKRFSEFNRIRTNLLKIIGR